MLADEIAAAGGWMPFARYMDLALYAPGLGYYAAGARKFGAAGDFVTAPEISPLFGQCVARCAASLLRSTGGDLLELGPGSGKLAADVLVHLDQIGSLPDRYRLLEVSADLRERQQARLAALPPHLSGRAEWLDTLPAGFDGVIVGNEVLDVLPVHLVARANGAWVERGVACVEGAFTWRDQPLADPALAAQADRLQARHFGGALPEGYLLEIAPQVEALVASLGGSMRRAALLFIDYGFRAAEYYHPARSMGTLMCHYRHFAHPDPFLFPGLQDITAHVDFSAVAHAGVDAGLTLAGYTTQAQFLIAAGLADLVPLDASGEAQLRSSQEIQRLTSPAEMGELFKVIGFTKGPLDIPAFAKARPLPL
ncbi:MAG: SAM-dependent methyltransferase [Betaproteobacteria bacterium]|nr:SAM-dependent methyltransferase [Betaproteobacteria bacterium]